MATAQEDRTTITKRAQKVVNALDPKRPTSPDPELGVCAGASPGHCIQRRVLITLGWLDPKLYGQPSIKKVSVPAIKRLQRAVGVNDDGDWRGATAGALARILEEALGRPIDTKASGQKPKAQSKAIAVVAPNEPAVPEVVALPEEKPPGFQIMGIPWWVALIAAGATGAGIWWTFRKGKQVGLSGCGGNMSGHEGHDHEGHDHDHDDEDDEQMPPEMAAEIEQLKQVPMFRPERKKAKG